MTAGRKIFKHCKAFTESLVGKRYMGADEMSERVQDFYQHLSEHLETQFNCSSDHAQDVMDDVEKYVMTRLYRSVFCSETSDDEKKDLAIKKRIKDLHWVTTEMLCSPLDEEILEVSDHVFKAIIDLTEMELKQVPKNKLQCMTSCSKHVFNAIKAKTKKTVSADDFLPTLIYIVLKTNPPRLISNIQYIIRFGNSRKSMSGEDDYYFTTLCCVVTFIENLDAQSLNLTSEQFELYMSDHAPSHWPKTNGASSSSGSAALSEVHTRLIQLQELEERQACVMENASLMKSDLIDWTDELEMQDLFSTTVIGSASQSAIDSDIIEKELLPQPLQP
ncbi:rab5 GDP/GTP exchange factor-like [Limanda limanda]|uniref:rab5 GDP/GTP exchange factor-like n=1 Tax=Limanda limanda TaxID=27771 RepID=UPI0029C8D0EB|nr:rab5 GDP/GTP exchange factor-like [Limanda limanda]